MSMDMAKSRTRTFRRIAGWRNGRGAPESGLCYDNRPTFAPAAAAAGVAGVVLMWHGMRNVLGWIDPVVGLGAFAALLAVWASCLRTADGPTPRRLQRLPPASPKGWLALRRIGGASPLDPNGSERSPFAPAGPLAFAIEVAGRYGSASVLDDLAARISQERPLEGFFEEWKPFYPEIEIRRNASKVDVVAAWWRATEKLPGTTAIPHSKVAWLREAAPEIWFAVLSVGRRRGVLPQGLPLFLAASRVVEGESAAEKRRRAAAEALGLTGGGE